MYICDVAVERCLVVVVTLDRIILFVRVDESRLSHELFPQDSLFQGTIL